MKVPAGYPPEVTAYLLEGLGKGMRSDIVELTKAGFGVPESPRLWYLEYRDTIQDLGLMELVLVPGLFRAFNDRGGLRAMASIHVDDTPYAGDETSDIPWEQLHKVLKFGKFRKATDGWQKFCGRWKRQSPDTMEMEYSTTEYTKNIPRPRVRTVPSAAAASYHFEIYHYTEGIRYFHIGALSAVKYYYLEIYHYTGGILYFHIGVL